MKKQTTEKLNKLFINLSDNLFQKILFEIKNNITIDDRKLQIYLDLTKYQINNSNDKKIKQIYKNIKKKLKLKKRRRVSFWNKNTLLLFWQSIYTYIK